jgi:hypothetical protein
LRAQAQVVLQVGLDMPVPIPDLRVDEAGVFGTLSFKGVPFACFVPWGAVFALVGDDAKGMVWHTDMPAEVAAEMERDAKKRVNGVADLAEVMELDAFRGSRADTRRSQVFAKKRPSSAPVWDRPSYLRVVK